MDTLAAQLLDAQVGWIRDQLTTDAATTIAADVDVLLEVGSRVTVGELIDAEAVKTIARSLAVQVPPSAGASTLVEQAARVAYDGPAGDYTLGEIVDREHVARLVDEVRGSADMVQQVLDAIANSPLAAGISARFVGRIVNDVVQANRAVAEKIPGVGSLVSFGASAAGKVMGAADKQIEQLLGDTAGKGAAFAMRRLNKIVVETLKDPTTRAAVLQVFDMYADEPIPRLETMTEEADAIRVAGLIQDLVITAAAAEPVLALVDALIDGFFEVYADYPVTTLLTDLDISRDAIVEHATALLVPLLGAVADSGELEALARQRLESFFASGAVAEILAAHG